VGVCDVRRMPTANLMDAIVCVLRLYCRRLEELKLRIFPPLTRPSRRTGSWWPLSLVLDWMLFVEDSEVWKRAEGFGSEGVAGLVGERAVLLRNDRENLLISSDSIHREH